MEKFRVGDILTFRATPLVKHTLLQRHPSRTRDGVVETEVFTVRDSGSGATYKMSLPVSEILTHEVPSG